MRLLLVFLCPDDAQTAHACDDLRDAAESERIQLRDVAIISSDENGGLRFDEESEVRARACEPGLLRAVWNTLLRPPDDTDSGDPAMLARRRRDIVNALGIAGVNDRGLLHLAWKLGPAERLVTAHVLHRAGQSIAPLLFGRGDFRLCASFTDEAVELLRQAMSLQRRVEDA